MSFQQKLSKIEKRFKYPVFAWVRKAEQELTLCINIPTAISYLCVLYSMDVEYFNTTPQKFVILSADKKSITRNHIQPFTYHANSFGNVAINSNSNCIHTWELKISRMAALTFKPVLVGVSSSNVCNQSILMMKSDPYYVIRGAYKYCHTMHGGQEFGTRYHEQDIITIILNLKDASVSFAINDENAEIAFNDIDQMEGLRYKVVVALPNKGDCIELQSYSETK